MTMNHWANGIGFSKTWLGRINQNKKTCENTEKSGRGHGQTADKFPGTFVRCLDPVLCMSLRILFFSIMFSVRILSRFLVKHCPLSIHPAAGQGRGKAVRTFDVLVRRRLLKNATPQFLRTKRLVKKLKTFLGMSQGQNQAGINFDFSRIYRKVPR